VYYLTGLKYVGTWTQIYF